MTVLVIGGFVAAAIGLFWVIVVRPRRLALEDRRTDADVAHFKCVGSMPEDPAIAAMRSVEAWPATDRSLDDCYAEACMLTADELEQRRLERAIQRHPAGGAR